MFCIRKISGDSSFLFHWKVGSWTKIKSFPPLVCSWKVALAPSFFSSPSGPHHSQPIQLGLHEYSCWYRKGAHATKLSSHSELEEGKGELVWDQKQLIAGGTSLFLAEHDRCRGSLALVEAQLCSLP